MLGPILEFLVWWLWDMARELAPLTGFQMALVPLVQGHTLRRACTKPAIWSSGLKSGSSKTRTGTGLWVLKYVLRTLHVLEVP